MYQIAGYVDSSPEIAMEDGAVLTNEFVVRYEENGECLCIHTVRAGVEEPAIKLRLETLKGMGQDAASKWVGETIMLLVPSLRTEVFGLPTKAR
jgi:hypothetical protein